MWVPVAFVVLIVSVRILSRASWSGMMYGGTLCVLAAPVHALTAQGRAPVVREYDRRAERASERWVVNATPTLVIGEVSGPEEYLLTNPLTAIRQADGVIVIRDSNQGYFSLRYYDSSGSHLATASRFGQGPFEFRYPLGVHGLPGDSILVLGEDGRFAVFGPRGESVREGRFDLADVLPAIPLSSHLVDATHIVSAKSPGTGLPPAGVHRDEVFLLLWNTGDAELDTLGTVLSSPTFYDRTTDGRGVYIYPYPYAPETSFTAGRGRVWVGQADVPEIRGYDSSGGLAVVIRFTDERKRVGWFDRRRFRSELLEGLTGDNERRFARYARSAEFPDTYPHFARLEVDRMGRLWVKRYEVPWSEEDQLWDVFGQDGGWIATVSIPTAVVPGCARQTRRTPCDRILEIGEKHILLDMGDPRDVRRVASFELSAGR
jgi:hypothetical protein